MSNPVPRALPARPDLEYERKQAKHLLRDAKRGNAAALARIRAENRGLASSKADSLKLADAQLAVAREYGFRSWPLLVRYFETFARHEKSEIYRNDLGDGSKDWWVKTILAEHRDRRAWTAALLGSFVPRFYGASIDEIFAAGVTEDDARLVVAREHGFARWEDMRAHQATAKRADPFASQSNPLRPFFKAIHDGDVAELDRLGAESPELISPESLERLGTSALDARIPGRGVASPAVVGWLRSHGADVQLLLNRRLRGFMGGHMDPAIVRALLDLGADPGWIAPNGYPVLEHALYRYWNGESVDLLLARTKPRDTFWVSAGVGDVRRLRRYFVRGGKLTPAARKNRPDLMALSAHVDAILPEPDDATILWEAAFVAAVNGRGEAFDVLRDHGFDIDDVRTGHTLLSFAVGNGLLPMVELLVSRGANPDIRGWRPNQTPREMCVGYLGRNMNDPALRRIVQLLGWDPDALEREHDARRGPPQPVPGLRKALAFAMQDANRRGESKVGLENFLVGIVCSPFAENEIVFLGHGGVDLHRLRERFKSRVTETSTNVNALPYDDALQAALNAAAAHAAKARDGITTGTVLHFAVESEPLAGIIRDLGGDVQKVKESMKRLLP